MNGGEREIIQWFARHSSLSPENFPIGIGDDMAEVRAGEIGSVLITTDMLTEGVHFDLETATLEQVGYKAMAVSLSDCAAMATRPVCAVVAVALPDRFGQEQLKQLHAGILRAGKMFECELVGGDITVWRNPLVVSSAMLSRPAEVQPVRRSGAKAADCICVTGALGGSREAKNLDFVPRVAEAIKMARLVKLHSMIDISDGLSTDLHHICTQSGVGAEIEAAKIPVSAAAKKSPSPLASALDDGEDFELLFTLSPADFTKLCDIWDEPLPITCIGRVTEVREVRIRETNGEVKPLQPGGYDHLKRGGS